MANVITCETRRAEPRDGRPLVPGRLGLPRCPRIPADLAGLLSSGSIRVVTLIPRGCLPWEGDPERGRAEPPVDDEDEICGECHEPIASCLCEAAS